MFVFYGTYFIVKKDERKNMIELTRLNGDTFVLNADLIEIVDANPDTVITLFNEHKFVVKDTMNEVVQKVIDYKKEAGLQVNIRKREV